MRLYGGSGRSSRWYGDEKSIVAGLLTTDAPEPPQKDRLPLWREEIRNNSPSRKFRLRFLRDPLTGEKTEKQLTDEWSLANGITVDSEAL